MSLVRLLPAWLHAVADYAVGAGLIVIALAVGGSGKAVAAGVVVGAIVLVVSMLTQVPARRRQGAAVHGALGRRLPRRRAAARRAVRAELPQQRHRPHRGLHRRRHRGARA